MATRRFFGEVGYVGTTVEEKPGVHVEQVIERPYYGEVIRNTRRLVNGEKVNNDLSVGNSISIVADEYASEHFFAIRYVRWAGAFWKVDDVRVESPRLILELGGIYNGTKAPASQPSS